MLLNAWADVFWASEQPPESGAKDANDNLNSSAGVSEAVGISSVALRADYARRFKWKNSLATAWKKGWPKAYTARKAVTTVAALMDSMPSGDQ